MGIQAPLATGVALKRLAPVSETGREENDRFERRFCQARARFSDGNNGTLTYTYNNKQVVKLITRQVFSSPLSACN